MIGPRRSVHIPHDSLPAALCAALALAPAAHGSVIRCPDWERFAPPVVLATAGDRQTGERFAAATGAGRATTAVRPAPVQADGGPSPSSARPMSPASAEGTESPAPSAACSHRIVSGDTLGGIASARLGATARWPEIAALNPGTDPMALRPGARLRLPCARDGDAVAPEPPQPRRRPFLARLLGLGAGGPGDAGSPPAPQPAPEPPLPVWKARGGEYLSDVLRRWGGDAGYTVIVDSPDAWRLGVQVRIRAAFEDAVAELVRGLGHDGRAPRVRIYPNAVLRLGGPV